jgi:hypothetical protein
MGVPRNPEPRHLKPPFPSPFTDTEKLPQDRFTLRLVCVSSRPRPGRASRRRRTTLVVDFKFAFQSRTGWLELIELHRPVVLPYSATVLQILR